MKSTLFVLLVAALLLPAPIQAREAPPSQPTGDWLTEFGPDRCMAARQFDTRLGKVFLRFEPDPISGSVEIGMTFLRGASADRPWGRLKLSIDEARQKDTATYYTFRAGGDQRLIIIKSQMRDLPADRDFILGMDYSTKGSLRFAVGGWTAARQQLEQCVKRFRDKYGITQEALDRIAHPAEGAPENFFSSNDYPVEAGFNGRAGTTKILIWIETDGSVSECKTITSSGVEALDEAACSAAIKRAKYKPATDTQWRPLREPTTLQIFWLRPAW